MSASCRPTCAISDTGRNAATEISVTSGSTAGASMPGVTSTAPSAATARLPSPVATSSVAAWNDRSCKQLSRSAWYARTACHEAVAPPPGRAEHDEFGKSPGSFRS